MTGGVFEEPPGATPLDPDEIEGLKIPNVQTRAQLNLLENANILQGQEWLRRSRKKHDLLSEEFARLLHEKLFGDVWEWAGVIRKTDKNIGVFPEDIQVEAKNLFDDVKTWIEFKSYGALEIAARFHHRLVYIHLFPNGNGRHARIYADLLLQKLLHHAPIDWAGGVSLDEIGTRRSEYIDALRAADQHDIGPLLKFVGATPNTEK